MANKKVSQLTSKPAVNLTDLFLIADPTSGQAFKTTISDLGTAIGSGVSSVNTLVGAVVLDTDDIQELASPTNRWFTDTRARAAVSASSPLAYNSGTGVFSIPAATSSQNGYLTSTDWTTFNAKQTALSGTGFVKISGTTISYDNSTYLTTSAAASTYLALSGGTLTGALNGTTATFTGDLTISSGNPRIYLTDTDNNPDYFISNTDGTFTIYDVTNSTSRFNITNIGDVNINGSLGIGSSSLTGYNLRVNKNITGATTSYGIVSEGIVQSDVTTSGRAFSTLLGTVNSVFSLSGLVHYQAQQSTIGASSTVTSQFGFVATASLIGAINNFGFYGDIAAGTNRWNLYMNGTANNYLAGNLGVGIDSSAWGNGQRAIQTPAGAIWNVNSSNMTIVQNMFSDGTEKYINNGFASSYNQNSGQHVWRTAPSGTAGNALTFTQVMTLLANGNLLLNTTADAGFKLDVNGTARVQGRLTLQNAFTIGNSFNTNRLGIIPSTTTSAFVDLYPFNVSGGQDVGFSVWSKGSISNITNYEILEFRYDNTARRYSINAIAAGTGTILPIALYTGANTNQLNLFTSGNVAINSGTDAGFRLDVNGTARVQGVLTATADALINGLTIGRGAGNNVSNTAIGISALPANTSSRDNTVVGYQAMFRNTTGERNTAVGVLTLAFNTIGNHNNAFGIGALYFSTGNDNNAIGFNSITNISSGNNNIGIGTLSGSLIAAGTANVTSNNSIFIGNDTRASANNQTNQIVIGHTAIGLGSNTTVLGNTSTTLTALYGAVITGGTSVNASAQFQVDSTTKGFLPPRMTSAQRTAIASPATGLIVYDTTLNKLSVYTGAAWETVTSL
jgi:hypothetical protein